MDLTLIAINHVNTLTNSSLFHQPPHPNLNKRTIEPPTVTLQQPEDAEEPTAPSTATTTSSQEVMTPDEPMSASNSMSDLQFLGAGARKLAIPTDLPGIQGQDLACGSGEAGKGKKGMKGMFVPEVEEIRVR